MTSHQPSRPGVYVAVWVRFISWLLLWIIVGVCVSLVEMPSRGGEAFTYLYGGLVVGVTGGAVYSLLLVRRRAKHTSQAGPLRGAFYGVLAAVPYLAIQAAAYAVSGTSPVIKAEFIEDAVLLGGCAVAGCLCIALGDLFTRGADA